MARFTGQDYDRMALELETMADKIRRHPEMNNHTSERLKVMAAEMRADAKSEYLITELIEAASPTVLASRPDA